MVRAIARVQRHVGQDQADTPGVIASRAVNAASLGRYRRPGKLGVHAFEPSDLVLPMNWFFHLMGWTPSRLQRTMRNCRCIPTPVKGEHHDPMLLPRD